MKTVKPLNLIVALGLTLDFTGALHIYGLQDAQGQTREHITAAILLGLAVLWLGSRDSDEETQGGAPAWLGFLPLAAGVLAISDIFTFVRPGWTPVRLAVFGSTTVALLALALRRGQAIGIALVAFLLGLAIRKLQITHIPIEPARGDMLPLVQQALGNLFQGRSPYATYFMPWELPLTYLPLTWLAFAPAYLAGMDVRWTNAVAEVAILGAALFVARRARPTAMRSSVDVVLLLWSWIFLLPNVIHWDVGTTAPIGWAAIAWTLAFVATARHGSATVALGLTAATTPLIAVFGPFIALCWWRNAGLGAAARRLAGAALLAGALLLPWYLWTPCPFVDGNLSWFNDLDRFPRMKWETERTWEQITGFSGFFWNRGWEQWLKPIQVLAVAGAAALYTLRGARAADASRYGTGAFLLFLLFNPVLWPYLYNPALVAGLMAVAGYSLAPERKAVHGEAVNGFGELIERIGVPASVQSAHKVRR